MVLAARLTVLGSLNMDISVTVPALPGPGATVLGGAALIAPGGKGANQAVAAARLGRGAGLDVRMVGCVGDDDFGRVLRAALRAEGVDDSAVRAVPGAPTGIAMITVDAAGENTITVAPGANREVGAADVAAVRDQTDVLVISAEIPGPAIRTALARTAPAGTASAGTASAGTGPATTTARTRRGLAGGRTIRLLNLAPVPPDAAGLIAAGPDWLVVNESEAAAILSRPVAGLAAAAQGAADLVAAGAGSAVVTAGAAGAAYCGPRALPDGAGRPGRRTEFANVTVPGFTVHAVDSVGAGDTFTGALAVALAAGVPPVEAVTAAAAAGAAAAARPGTQSGMPYPADILAVTGHSWPVAGR
jgi:ribokinase